MAYGALKGCIYWPMIGEVKWRRCVVNLLQIIAFFQNSVTPCWDACVLTSVVSETSDSDESITYEVS